MAAYNRAWLKMLSKVRGVHPCWRYASRAAASTGFAPFPYPLKRIQSFCKFVCFFFNLNALGLPEDRREQSKRGHVDSSPFHTEICPDRQHGPVVSDSKPMTSCWGR